MTDAASLALGFAIGALAIPAAWFAFRLFTVAVEDEESVLVTRFGKYVRTLERPGLHILPSRILPWVRLRKISRRRDFRVFPAISINDSSGATVVVDVWLELRIADPVRATFEVADWDRSLRNLVTHAVISTFGNHAFREILCDRTQLGERLRKEIATETARWGLEIELAFVQNVSLLPEVSQGIFESIAARLERAKADIEEEGRQRVALLEAETSARVATLVAEARGQYPAAIGRAYRRLGESPAVLAAYEELYDLSLLDGGKTVAFKGFGADDVRALDAAMIVPSAIAAARTNGDGREAPAHGHAYAGGGHEGERKGRCC